MCGKGLQLQGAGGAGIASTYAGQTFYVEPDETWWCSVMAQRDKDGGVVVPAVVVRDVTNGADISLTVTGEAFTSSPAWQLWRAQFTVPSGCRTASFRIGFATAVISSLANFAWAQLYRDSDYEIPLPVRITAREQIADVYELVVKDSDPIAGIGQWERRPVRYEVRQLQGVGYVALRLPDGFGGKVICYDEWQTPYAASSAGAIQASLSADTDTCDMPLDDVTDATALYLYKMAEANWRSGESERTFKDKGQTNPWTDRRKALEGVCMRLWRQGYNAYQAAQA